MTIELHVGLDVIEKMLSDPVWREAVKNVSCKDELKVLLLRFCSERGEIIKVDEKKVLLFVDH